MKPKSLRQVAKEIGVSHSYLSQVRHGKRPRQNWLTFLMALPSLLRSSPGTD